MAECFGYSLLLLGSLAGCWYTKRKGCGLQYRKYLRAAVVIGVVCLGVSAWEQTALKPEPVQALKRGQAGTGTEEVLLSLDAKGVLKQYQYPVVVEEQRITGEETEQIFFLAGQELEKRILGENESLEAVSGDLSLPRTLQEGAVEVSYYFDPYELVASDGAILWENRKEDQNLVEVTAEMKCQEYQAVHSFYIQLLPREPEGAEALVLFDPRTDLSLKNPVALRLYDERQALPSLALPPEAEEALPQGADRGQLLAVLREAGALKREQIVLGAGKSPVDGEA